MGNPLKKKQKKQKQKTNADPINQVRTRGSDRKRRFGEDLRKFLLALIRFFLVSVSVKKKIEIEKEKQFETRSARVSVAVVVAVVAVVVVVVVDVVVVVVVACLGCGGGGGPHRWPRRFVPLTAGPKMNGDGEIWNAFTTVPVPFFLSFSFVAFLLHFLPFRLFVCFSSRPLEPPCRVETGFHWLLLGFT